MANLFDRFAGAAAALNTHTADSGHTWGGNAAQWSLDGIGGVYRSGGTFTEGAMPFSSWVPASADYRVDHAVAAAFIGSANQIGVILRASGSSPTQNYYLFQIIETGGGNASIQVHRYVSGGYTAIGTWPNITVAADSVLRYEISGSSTTTLSLYVDGVLSHSATDSASPITAAGSVGIRNDANPSISTCWAGTLAGPVQTISPTTPTVAAGGTQVFTMTGAEPGETIRWSAVSGSFSPATGTSSTYTAPGSPTTDTITWRSDDLSTHTASTSVTISNASSLTLSGPTSGLNGVASTNFTVTATTLSGADTVTPHTNLTGTFAPTSQAFSAGSSSHTFTYTPGATGTHAITITDTLGATINGSPITYTSSAGAPPVVGGATFANSTTSTINMVCASNTGTSGQWYRSPTSNFTPGPGTILTGKTSLSLGDTTASPATDYWYKFVGTNAAGSTSSNQAYGRLHDTTFAFSAIGDSTYTGFNANNDGLYDTAHAIPYLIGQRLAEWGEWQLISVDNQAAGGQSTAYWFTGGAPTSVLTSAIAAATTNGSTWCTIMIGSNDTATLRPAATYGANLAGIVNAYVSAGIKVILHYPYLWPTDAIGVFNASQAALLKEYMGQIDLLIDDVNIFAGDKTWYYIPVCGHIADYLCNDEAHLSVLGNIQAAASQSHAFWNVLHPGSGGGSSVTLTPDGLDAIVIETGINARQALSLALSALAGKSLGLAANAPIYKGANNNTTRIAATTDANGNRSVVTLTPPA